MTLTATGNRMTREIARQAGLAQDIARTQVSISSGKRLRTAADDPVAAELVGRIAQAQSDGTTWKTNLAQGAALAAQADGVLAGVSDRLVQARTLLIGGASGTATAADRTTYANELRSIASDVAGLRATTTPTGEALFAAANAPRFRVDRDVVMAPVDTAANVFEYGGGSLVADLTEAAAALESGDDARIGVALSRLGSGIDHVADAAADQGLRAARVDRLIDRQAVRDIDLAAERSGLEDTDLTVAIAQLNAQRLTLDAAQAAFARINRRSLFDLLS